MPYKTNAALPPAVKKLPARAMSIWRKAFNNAVYQEKASEESAFKIAWSAVHKAGFGKDKESGKWGKGKGR